MILLRLFSGIICKKVQLLHLFQVLQYPYTFDKARLVVREMADMLALELVDKKLVTNHDTRYILRISSFLSMIRSYSASAAWMIFLVDDVYSPIFSVP